MAIRDEIKQARIFKPILGHDIMDVQRFAEDTRHMIVFDVLNNERTAWFKGDRIRVFLSEEGYDRAIESEKQGEITIIRHYRIRKGDLIYSPHKPMEEHEQLRI